MRCKVGTWTDNARGKQILHHIPTEEGRVFTALCDSQEPFVTGETTFEIWSFAPRFSHCDVDQGG
jgi:hypothetical protein